MKNRERTAMAFFVLAVISRGGLCSLYELQRGVALEPGGIRPLLVRLEQEGLLQRSEPGHRRRKRMTVTQQGEQLLKEEWEGCLQDYPDSESILRAATVALLMGRSDIARDYLMGIADTHQANVPTVPCGPGTDWSPVDWYTSMRLTWERRRHESAAEVFREIAKHFREDTNRR